MKLRVTLLAACIAAAAAVPARAQTTPAPADSAIHAATPAEHAQFARAQQAAAARVRRDPDLITAAEVDGTIVSDALTLVQQLRPQWLRARSASRASPVIVYVNGGRLGSVRELRTMKAESVGEMRFIRSEEAVPRFGMDHRAGAILVTMR
ncbi:MAG: hypothetical protein ACJ8J0_13025 [Longimicrobiaceae bacterium]